MSNNSPAPAVEASPGQARSERRKQRRKAAQNLAVRFFRLFFGRPLANGETEEQKVGALGGVPILGLDALGSASYGPEAALTILIPLGAVGLAYERWVICTILALLGMLYFSYRQTIAAYPNGGGSYTVAKENLGVHAGLLAGAALILDYVLNVAVGISAGVGALESAVPPLQAHRVAICLGVLAVVVLMNLRGVRESGLAWSLPTYGFILTLLTVVGIGVYKTWISGGHPQPVVAAPARDPATATVSIWLLMRAFAGGCTAMTGVEAVSNGVPIFSEPREKRARGTLTIIVVCLAALLLGIGYLSGSYQVGALSQDRPGYESVVSQLVSAIIGKGPSYFLTIGCVLLVLILSANTSFADFPRLCSLLARDRFLPPVFASLGRRLVFTTGILILALLSGILLVLFQGVTDHLIPLFAVGAFGAFTMSQAGMVQHWRKAEPARWSASLLMNAIGAIGTASALIVIVIAKFAEGAWITMLIIAGLVRLFIAINRHYSSLSQQISPAPTLRLAKAQPPLVIIPMESWNRVAERAMRFALRVSEEITAVHVTSDEDTTALREIWTSRVIEPARRSGIPTPRLEIVNSPYRELLRPLVDYVDRTAEQNPGRTIAVVIPELVHPRWWEYLLYNSSSAGLKAALLFLRDDRVVVISTPWYLREPSDH